VFTFIAQDAVNIILLTLRLSAVSLVSRLMLLSLVYQRFLKFKSTFHFLFLTLTFLPTLIEAKYNSPFWSDSQYLAREKLTYILLSFQIQPYSSSLK